MICVEPYLIAFGTGMHYSVMQELVSNLRDALRKNKLEKIQTLTESFDPPLKSYKETANQYLPQNWPPKMLVC